MLGRWSANLATARLVGTACLILLTGCQQSEYARQRIGERERSLSWTLNQCAESERSRPGKLNNTFAIMGDVIKEDAEQLDRNARWVGSIIESDARRFEERQPVYRATILDILDGRPESLERTAIDLFY